MVSGERYGGGVFADFGGVPGGERLGNTAAYFEQEYMCRFTASEGAYFDPTLIDAAVDLTIPGLEL